MQSTSFQFRPLYCTDVVINSFFPNFVTLANWLKDRLLLAYGDTKENYTKQLTYGDQYDRFHGSSIFRSQWQFVSASLLANNYHQVLGDHSTHCWHLAYWEFLGDWPRWVFLFCQNRLAKQLVSGVSKLWASSGDHHECRIQPRLKISVFQQSVKFCLQFEMCFSPFWSMPARLSPLTVFVRKYKISIHEWIM